MADYLLVHDYTAFERLRPVLATAYAQRSFAGWETHLGAWRAAALRYALAYHIDPGDIFLLGVGPQTRFSAATWRTLVGELLVVTAVAMPELPGHLESLARLLPSPLAAQALGGCADLVFGLATYRPGQARYNSAEANGRLLGELRAVDPGGWTGAMLASEEVDAEDAREELLYARDWFAVVIDLYECVVRDGRVIVFEDVYG